MPSFIIVEKTGSLKNAKTTDLVDLYKKCGFKTNEGFSLAHAWSVEFNDTEYKMEIYGKITGRANTENKYEFPPPIDNVLFFGNCAAVLYVNNKMTDMGTQEFKDIMEHLYGGYSDIGDSDEDEDEEDENASDHHQLVARNIQIDIFQVVGAGTAYADLAERTASIDVVKQVVGV